MLKKLQRIRFSKKLFISYLLICTIPLLLTTNVFYLLAKQNIEHYAQSYSHIVSSQFNNTINLFIGVVDNTSQSIFTEYDILKYLGREASFSNLEKINHNLAIHNMLAHFSIQMPFLQGITLISSSGIEYKTGRTPDILTLDFLNEQPWYRDILNSNGQLFITPAHDSVTNTFSAGRLVTDSEARKAGVLLFHMTPLTLLSKDYFVEKNVQSRILLHSPNGQLIYDSHQDQGLPLDHNRYFIHSNESESTGLKVTIAVSKAKLYENIEIFRKLSFLIVGVMLLLIAISSSLLSYQITRPIVKLMHNMTRAEAGYYQPLQIREAMSVEFYELMRTYNILILKIKHLIEVVHIAQLKQNEAKFIALQNQINPHWLYNTLESIRMQAQIGGRTDVASMIKTLGRLFRMSLSNNHAPHLIRHEMDHVLAYLELQNIRYEGRFKLVTDLPESIMQLPIIKLIFQPIVENSIKHGFLNHSQDYHIYISAETNAGFLHIQITDDGVGMTEQKLDAVRDMLRSPQQHLEQEQDRESSSVGLLNIQERLQLHYGKQCGLFIDSVPDEGTSVSIRIPYRAEGQHVQSHVG